MNLFNTKKKGSKKTSKTQPKKKLILSRKQKIIAAVGGVLVLGGIGYWAYSAYTMDEVNAGGCVSTTYKKGSKSTCIKYAQQMLGIKADSSFNAATLSAVKSFQTKHGMKNDGVIKASTWSELCYYGVNDTAKQKAGCSLGNTPKGNWTRVTWGGATNGGAEASVVVYACRVRTATNQYQVRANFVVVSSKGNPTINVSLSTGHQGEVVHEITTSANDGKWSSFTGKANSSQILNTSANSYETPGYAVLSDSVSIEVQVSNSASASVATSTYNNDGSAISRPVFVSQLTDC